LNILYENKGASKVLKLNHIIQEYLDSTQRQIIQEGDLLEFVPIRGRKRSFTLNRAYYDIIIDPDISEIKKINHKIFVPGSKGQVACISLKLHEDGPFNAYFLNSKNNELFIFNGRVTNFSFIKNNDGVNLGFNLMNFFKSKNQKNMSFTNMLNKDAVKSNYSILIQGETGTGKTTLARKIHDESERWGEFVHLNISAFSKELVESELFGHCKGAFTGALSDKKGAIIEANNGTLFLDEIDSVSIEIQTKLLTFLDNSEFRLVGGGVRKSNVRLIFSSGQDLRSLVSSGKMRLDFYYRIKSSHTVNIPSLRDNEKYCKVIIQEFLDEKYFSINPQLMKWYLSCPWFGNIRQLHSHLTMKMIASQSRYLNFDNSDMSLKEESFQASKLLEDTNIIKVSDLKKKYIKQMLMVNRGDFKITSKQIGVSENTIRRCL
jgi:transcriptional regulator of acetoin/glycerol metabolism